MKKLISIPISLLMIISCSCSSNSKKEKEPDYKTLDSSWECDYLKISTNSNWQEHDYINDNITNASWQWDVDDDTHYIDLDLYYDSVWDKLSQNELVKHWEDYKEYALADDTLKSFFEGYYVEDSFVKNGQAYLIVANENSDVKKIEFYTDNIHGTFRYHVPDNEIVLNMVDSIVFY